VGAGATRHLATMSYRAYCPCPLGGWGEFGTPQGFWFFFPKKEQSFSRDIEEVIYKK
jgi:hypothetical protein